MNKAEIRKKIEELLAKRKEMLEKIDAAKDDNELDGIERELRKLNIQLDGYKTQLASDDRADDLDGDPAIRKDEPEVDTRSIKPLMGVVKAPVGTVERKDIDTDDIAYRKAFMDFALRKKPIPAELRADAVTMTDDVSAVIPTTIINRILEEIENIGMILPLVTRTYYKGYVSIPVSNVRPVASWVGEGQGSDKQKKTVNNTIDIKAFKLRCAISMTLEVDVMSLEVFESTFVRQVLEAMTKALEEAIISGEGPTATQPQPKGILTETPPEGQAFKATVPTYQLITDMEGALPSAYERNAVWCMTKKTFMSFVGMVDANGQPIARVNAGFNGRPERTLIGRPVLITDYIDSYSKNLAEDKVWAFIFDFKDYVLNMNMNIRTKWYEDNENEDQVFKAVALADGKAIRVNSLVTVAMGTETAAAKKTSASKLTD